MSDEETDETPAVETSSAPEPGVAQESYTGLTLEARKDKEHGLWEFGVNLSGAFIVIGVRRAGRVDDLIRESIEPGFLEARAAAHSREVLGVPR